MVSPGTRATCERSSHGDGEERAGSRTERQGDAFEILRAVDVVLELGDARSREAAHAPGTDSALSGPYRAEKTVRIRQRQRVRRPVVGLDESEPRGREPPQGLRRRAGRSAFTTSACPSTRARPVPTAAPSPSPGSPTISTPRGTTTSSSVTTSTRPTSAAASITSPSMATAAPARIETGSRRLASPRYGITIAGTRRSVLRRRSTRCRHRGRTSPTRRGRTSARCAARHRPRHPCGPR